MALVGNEILYVQGVTPNGSLSGNNFATTTGAVAALAGANPNAPIAVGAAATAVFGRTFLLNTAAGSILTLPAATGSGGKIIAVVSVTATSNAHKILAASVSDFLIGIAQGHVSAGTTLSFSSAGATNHSIQMPFAGTQPSGGFIGDYFEFIDIGAGLWEVNGTYQSGTTSTTPFSTATT